MRIGEPAEATGTAPRALRHCERQGLITSVRAADGCRAYATGTAVRVGA
ncbi:MerR family DNA-binding transcriptional regulator [Streptomyces sp. NPDC004457]